LSVTTSSDNRGTQLKERKGGTQNKRVGSLPALQKNTRSETKREGLGRHKTKPVRSERQKGKDENNPKKPCPSGKMGKILPGEGKGGTKKDKTDWDTNEKKNQPASLQS